MAVSGRTVPIGVTPVLINSLPDNADLVSGSSLVLRNKGAVSLYLGGLTDGTNGFEIAATESISLDVAGGDLLYAVTASGTTSCNVLQTGV